MSLTETPAAPAPKPAKKRRVIKRKKKPLAAAPPKPTGIFEGLAPGKCPNACNAEKCVISGINVCANPGLGGLQSALQTPERLARFNEAKRFLGEQKLDLTRFK